MDIYDSRYFCINKKLIKSLGLWPYESRRQNFCKRFVVLASMIIVTVPHVISFYNNFGKNVDSVLENIFQIIYLFGIAIKIVTTMVSEERMKIVYENTARDFETIVEKDERAILFEYSERGRLISIYFIIYMFFALNFYIATPTIPIVLDFLLPLNESRQRIFINNGDFLVDKHQYYAQIYLFDTWCCYSTIYVACSIDPMYATIVEHCIALFAIINFTRLLEISYSTYFLLEIGASILLLSVTSVLILIRLDQMFETARFMLTLVGVMIHLFYLSWPSQKMIDHSSNLYQDTYLNEWYETSIQNQNLLKFMALRCSEPCQLTAGRLYIMNFMNFASVVKTSVSYITVFSSFR